MSTFEELAAKQSETGESIQKIIRNYKKDPAERKTSSEYFKQRLERLEKAWSNFESVDYDIRSLPNPPLTHPYFAEGYYDKIKVVYEEYHSNFLENLACLEDAEKAAASPSKNSLSKGALQSKASSQETVARTGMISLPSTSRQDIQTEDNDLAKAIRGQKRIIESLRRLLNTLNPDQQPKSYCELKIEAINHQWKQIEDYDRYIWESSDDPITKGYNPNSYVELEEETQRCLILLSAKLELLSAAIPQPVAQNNNSPLPKLPKISLPKFDGDYLKWCQFYDLFSQLVHNQPMSNCQKMWYLKTNLSGEAERLLRHFTLSDENYSSAWQMLQDRYSNNRLLVAALINKLLSQPSHTNDNPSAANLKALHDTTQECLLGLQNLNIPIRGWDPLLLHILTKKLDKTTHMLYEQSLSNPKELQTMEGFLKFIETRFQSLEALGAKSDYHKRQSTAKTLTSVVSSTHNNKSCASCKGNHPLFSCKTFLKLSPIDRLNLLRKHNLCINCLKSGHNLNSCISRGCTRCNRKHNTLVHLESASKHENCDKSSSKEQKSSTPVTEASNSQRPNDQPVTLAALKPHSQRSYVLLGTAIVNLVTNEGRNLECRAILDSGSQINLITERVVKKLKLSPSSELMFIQGIGQGKCESKQKINIQLQSRLNGFNTQLEAFVLPQIVTPQPTQYFDISSWPIPKNIKLADPNFNSPNRVDLLLGAEFYHQLLSVGQIRLADDLPVIQNTVFGWIITGKINQPSLQPATCGICSEEEEEETNRLIERFWKLEEVETNKPALTIAENRCEMHFAQTVQRDINGRFVVGLPFAENPSVLGDSKQMALKRFLALEKKLAKNDHIKQQYIDFMHEYLQLGHMKEINMDDIPTTHYFLPHHCVLKPDSSTTKLRVVFDASAKTSSGYALNDILYAGPTIQSDLFSILLRFRLPRFVFTTDIQKMYRQILLHEGDQNYQLIFWRRNPEEPLRCYQLCTVTYGTRPAPYLATKCLQNLASEKACRYPLGAPVLKNDFYVDDGMTGSDSLATAIEMQQQLSTMLQEAGFKLRKWCANHPRLLQGIPPEDQEVDLDFNTEAEEKIKTLGLTWLPKTDQFRVRANCTYEDRITKRVVSSELAKIFDPLGIMAPVVVTAKIFTQKLWQLKLKWDEALPLELHTQWMIFRHNLKVLDNITFPRHVFGSEIPKGIQIHAFADASEKAYGAAVYVRSITKDNRIAVRLLCAKTRVAPLQKQTLPRLELCAAVVAAQLVSRVRTGLNFQDIPTHFWTDSEIVLHWINSSSSAFQTFVANRIAKIQELSLIHQWRHVASKENPADILSRGLPPEKLASCNLWFYGPLFLHGKESTWPAPYSKTRQFEDDQEKRRVTITRTVTMATSQSEDIIYTINHGNSFRRLQRIIAYMQRFINHTKHPSSSRPNQIDLTAQELDEALFLIIRNIQAVDFKDEITQLKKYGEVKKGSSIHNLNAFLDKKGIIRVGGRLKSSSLPYDAKHQMLLPYDDPLTKLLMTTIHKENLHCGSQALHSHTRQRFWPIKGKIMARSIVHHCVTCTRAKPKLLTQMMADLPASRVQPARPFVHSGVDFCGPFWVHYKIRGKKPHKAYIAVFCCFATKAVHMELVSDLTTEAFIGALKRFISRRGHCRKLYCDNATNFVGANNKLKELQDSIYSNDSQGTIIRTCSNKGIDFHFIPPRAPHFGGLWEAAVKSAKHLLLRSASSASLTYEELETVVVEIEAILNSRPITPMSTDPNDLTALTPGHFLIGEPLTAQVDSNALPFNKNLFTRWKLVTRLKTEFWNRWSREYLNELQYRHKWKEQMKNITPDTMVIVKDDNLPVMQWPLGRIVKTYNGKDGLVRVVDVRTASGILTRPIHRLSPLPIERTQSAAIDSEEQMSSLHESDNEITSRAEPSMSTATKEENAMPRKRMKVSRGSFITTLLLACTMFPIARGSPINITQFDPNPGIHFENIGTVNLIATEWKLIIYYDLQPYWTETAALLNGTLALKHLCQQLRQKSICTPIVNQFEHVEDELKLDNSLFSTSRHKRGAVDIVGNVANSLFGILDSEYARQMSETINSIKDNEGHLLGLLRNQTSIIDSTVNIIKRDQLTTERKFKALEDQVAQILNRISTTGEETHQIKLFQLLTSLSIQMTIVASNLQRVQSAVITALTDTQHGRLSPLILSPKQLREELITIKNHLPISIQLPVNQEDTLQLYKLMSVEGRVVNNHVIFKIKLPLIDQNNFDLFKVIPIPAIINNTMVAIKPSTAFLAINSHRDKYYPITDNALSSCTELRKSIYLCTISHPIYHKGARVCACEVNLFNKLSKPDCELRKVENSPVWIQLNHENQWIYSLKTPTRMNAVCGQEPFQLVLEGSGLLRMEPLCVIKYDLITIQGHHIFPSSTRLSYTSTATISEITSVERLRPILEDTVQYQYQSQLEELNALQNLIASQDLTDLPNRIESYKHHHFTIGYLTLSLSLIIILYLTWKFRGDIFKCTKKSRSLSTQASNPNFTVHI